MPADLPPELLVEKLARLEGVCCRTCAEEALTALAEWADGALIDPATWTRWDRSVLPLPPISSGSTDLRPMPDPYTPRED